MLNLASADVPKAMKLLAMRQERVPSEFTTDCRWLAVTG